jgi:hypothetical protein
MGIRLAIEQVIYSDNFSSPGYLSMIAFNLPANATENH